MSGYRFKTAGVIRAEIETKDGILGSLKVEGHDRANGRKGSVLCASVTALVRSAARTLEKNGAVKLEGAAETAGSLFFRITGYDGRETGWLKGVTDLLVTGLEDIAREYPRKVIVAKTGI